MSLDKLAYSHYDITVPVLFL
jgi:hypothetical protein